MKSLLFVISVFILCGCSAKKTTQDANKNKGTSSVSSGKGSVGKADTVLPGCIKKLIREFQQEEKQNPPRSIYSYTYNGKLVYYVPAVCCDFFSDLYDSDCKLIAHPDGGFTGRGDGSAGDFLQIRTSEKLIWKDERL